MIDRFFENPILNSPYQYPGQHWELDDTGQPTGQIVEKRRRADFITPIPKPKKQKRPDNTDVLFDEGKGLSSREQQYDPTAIINMVRQEVDNWRKIKDPGSWGVTPETARLLQHWRHHQFQTHAQEVKNLPDGDLKWTGGPDHGSEIRCGKVKYRIPGMPGDDFPPLPSAGKAEFVDLDAEMVGDLIAKTQY